MDGLLWFLMGVGVLAVVGSIVLVRTVPRGGTPGDAPAITAANVPPIAATPAAADRIDYSAGVLTIPD